MLGCVALANPTLNVTNDDGATLLSLDLSQDHTWVIQWNHSVSGISVSDFYTYKEGQMVLTDSHTPRFDAGLGYITGRGRLESDARHGYWIRDIDESVPGNAYYLRVGPMRVNHRIVHAGVTYSLSELAANERVRLGVVP